MGEIHSDTLAMEQGAAHGIYGAREAECGRAFKKEGPRGQVPFYPVGVCEMPLGKVIHGLGRLRSRLFAEDNDARQALETCSGAFGGSHTGGVTWHGDLG